MRTNICECVDKFVNACIDLKICREICKWVDSYFWPKSPSILLQEMEIQTSHQLQLGWISELADVLRMIFATLSAVADLQFSVPTRFSGL